MDLRQLEYFVRIAELGALLLELWEIPSSIANAVRSHHEPSGDVDVAAHVARSADLLAHAIDRQAAADAVAAATRTGAEAAPVDEADAIAWADDEARLEYSLQLLGIERDDITERSLELLRRAGLVSDPANLN